MRAVPTNRYIVYFLIVIVGCAIDWATKYWIFSWLGMPGADGKTWWIWPQVLGFQTSLNQGALFGMAQGMVPLLAAASIIALLGILYWLFVHGAAQDWLLTVALGSISAGILGNLYDRLGLPGLVWQDSGQRVYAVRDWIRFSIGNYTWPNFNVADSLLVCGALLLIGHAFLLKPAQQVQKPATISETSSEAKP
jgi:signal peptidase II